MQEYFRTKAPHTLEAAILLNDDFSGLSLRLHREIGVNLFAKEWLGLFAIAALKQQALLPYDDVVMDFHFMDHDHPEPPLLMVLEAETQYLLHNRVKRSTVAWTIDHIAVDMMRTQYLHTLTFDVMCYSDHIYNGFVILDRNNQMSQLSDNGSSLSTRAPANPLSFSSVATNSTTVAWKPQSNLTGHPPYSIVFAFVPRGAELSPYQFLRAYLRFLLQLAKPDAASHQPQVGMDQRDLPAWIFMKEAEGVPRDRMLKQYHVVTIAEAMARYQQQHHDWREMTFRFLAGGQLVATGCVTRAVRFREWCGGMFFGEHPGDLEHLDMERRRVRSEGDRSQ
ncbi:MAG: hypothetical protein Q9213_002731 [Squamulea squamosa]